MEEIRFKVNGIEIAADLYLPEELVAGERRPAIVAGHGFSVVKEALAEQGAFFSKAGYIVLCIDYRSFGRSGGEVRGQLFPNNMVEDFSAGISYLQTRGDVQTDRIAIWGTSFGGGIVLRTAAVDRRVRAVIAQVPVADGRRWMKSLRTNEAWEKLLDKLDEDRARRFSGKPSERVPVMEHWQSGKFSAMPTDDHILSFREYMMAKVPTWRQDIALESIEKVIEFNPTASIAQIGPRPLCIIAAAGYETTHPLDHILEAFSKAMEPKYLHMAPFDQLGMYGGEGQEYSHNVALDFLEKHLPVHGTVGGSIRSSTWAMESVED